jgi:uncharacterized protein (TIGR02271 family)
MIQERHDTSRPDPDDRIELVEERLTVEKRDIERGRVVVRKHVDTREEIAEAVLQQDELSVERVPLGVPVDAPPPVREEGDVLIVPVLEEQLVIQTRLILKEELRITRRRREETFRQPVHLRAERAEVVREEAGRDPGDTTDSEGHPS